MKEQLLALFKKSPGEYLSGETLSQAFSVTRAAVWKSVKQLQEDGYRFDSKPRQGYRLTGCPDIPYPWEIKPLIQNCRIGRTLLYFREVDSTSNVALREALSHPEDGLVVVASAQTAGRGRMAESWSSPSGTGLYFSLVLTPPISMAQMGEITQLIAQAVCGAIRERHGLVPVFAMPGDVLLHEKKLCGILTEALGELERARLVVTGVGVNVGQGEEELGPGKVSLAAALGNGVSLCGLFASILRHIDVLYTEKYGLASN